MSKQENVNQHIVKSTRDGEFGYTKLESELHTEPNKSCSHLSSRTFPRASWSLCSTTSSCSKSYCTMLPGLYRDVPTRLNIMGTHLDGRRGQRRAGAQDQQPRGRHEDGLAGQVLRGGRGLCPVPVCKCIASMQGAVDGVGQVGRRQG